MADLHPFRAYRYDPDVVGPLDRVVTQPYDKMPPELQRDYYDRSPYNAARVTLSLEKEKDSETDYPEAGETLRRWIHEAVLVQDRDPAIYPYYQDYEVEGERRARKGFLALLGLKTAGILPHERTMAAPKLDRLRLLRQIECNEDPIFMLYTDEQLAVNRVLDAHAEAPPLIDVADDYGVRHRVWAIRDAAAIRSIRNAMAVEELFIADGHHRWETAVTFMNECRAAGWTPGAVESFDKRLVACFNSADAGITILPTHRVVRDLPRFDSGEFLQSAARYFEVVPVASADAMHARMKEERGSGHAFGFYGADGRAFVVLLLRDEAKVDPLMLAHPEVYRHLDVAILHTLVLDRLLGVDEAKLVAQAHVDYVRDRTECIRRVEEGSAQAVFFLNPTTVEQVQRVALVGERMPQKSTDFYPKLLTGLTFVKMEIRK